MTLRTFEVLSVVFLLAASSAMVASAIHSNTGILEPLYSYPAGSAWTVVEDAKRSYPNVPLAVIVNPDNGPGTCCDSYYQTGIARLKAAGVIVLGYVYTSYCSRPIAHVESDIDAWKNLYQKNGTVGISFDQMTHSSLTTCADGISAEAYYSTLTRYVKSGGFTFVVGNPGTDTQPSFFGSLDAINIYEGPGMPTNSTLAGSSSWHLDHDKENFSFVAYNVTATPSKSDVLGRSLFVGWLYVTDGTNAPNPFIQPAPYLSTLLSYLNNPSVRLKIRSISIASNQQVSGYHVVIYQPSAVDCSYNCIVRRGFTPLDYNATVGWTYTLNAQSFGACAFDHWDDGSTNPFRTVVAPQLDTLYTAHYAGTC